MLTPIRQLHFYVKRNRGGDCASRQVQDESGLSFGLQEQLLASQEALKSAKAESARRLKTLQSLQQQVRPLHSTLFLHPHPLPLAFLFLK